MKETNFLSDVTLVCEDNSRFEAHKLVLSACSPVLRSIMELEPPWGSSVLYLHGIGGMAMSSLLEFMYQGQTIFRQECLQDFIEVANRFSLSGVSFKDLNNSASDQKTSTIKQELENSEATKQVCPEEKSILNEFEQLVSDENINNFKEDIERNIKIESASKRFPCSMCKYETTQKGHLNGHIKAVHDRIKDICEMCNKEFFDKSNLKKHIGAVHENVKYKCDQCDKEYKGQQALRNHMRSFHEGIKELKKYECDQCGEKYQQNQTLKRHIESKHLGIKYTCNSCGKKFSSKNTLNLHEKHFCQNL